MLDIKLLLIPSLNCLFKYQSTESKPWPKSSIIKIIAKKECQKYISIDSLFDSFNLELALMKQTNPTKKIRSAITISGEFRS